jgi:hypothetical protein
MLCANVSGPEKRKSVKLGLNGNCEKNGATIMTIEDLQRVYDSLLECGPDVEDFSWGPTYEFAMQRRETALKILMKAIDESQ